MVKLTFSSATIIVVLLLSLIYFREAKSDDLELTSNIEELTVEELILQKNVHQRNLIRENIKATSILQNYNKYYKDTEKRLFGGRGSSAYVQDIENDPLQSVNTLAYITPWNKKGYENSILFRHKFTHISPVWFQIKPYSSSPHSLIIEGQHNIDKDWMMAVRNQSNTKIIPRFNFEGESLTIQLLHQEFQNKKFILSLVQTVKENNFDGLVLEGLYFVENKQIRNGFIEKLSNELHKLEKELFIVIQPINKNNIQQKQPSINNNDIKDLSEMVDGFSLMTYDFDPRQAINSPLQWMKDNLNYYLSLKENTFNSDDINRVIAKKLLLGLPFYGYKHSLVSNNEYSAVMSWDFIDILKDNKKTGKFTWNTATYEHNFTYKDKSNYNQKVTYPTLLFLEERLSLAKKYHTSISIWELGQGMNYFYDLL